MFSLRIPPTHFSNDNIVIANSAFNISQNTRVDELMNDDGGDFETRLSRTKFNVADTMIFTQNNLAFDNDYEYLEKTAPAEVPETLSVIQTEGTVGGDDTRNGSTYVLEKPVELDSRVGVSGSKICCADHEDARNEKLVVGSWDEITMVEEEELDWFSSGLRNTKFDDFSENEVLDIKFAAPIEKLEYMKFAGIYIPDLEILKMNTRKAKDLGDGKNNESVKPAPKKIVVKAVQQTKVKRMTLASASTTSGGNAIKQDDINALKMLGELEKKGKMKSETSIVVKESANMVIEETHHRIQVSAIIERLNTKDCRTPTQSDVNLLAGILLQSSPDYPKSDITKNDQSIAQKQPESALRQEVTPSNTNVSDTTTKSIESEIRDSIASSASSMSAASSMIGSVYKDKAMIEDVKSVIDVSMKGDEVELATKAIFQNKIPCNVRVENSKITLLDAKNRSVSKYFPLDIHRIISANFTSAATLDHPTTTLTIHCIAPRKFNPGSKLRSFTISLNIPSTAEKCQQEVDKLNLKSEIWCKKAVSVACRGNVEDVVLKAAVLVVDARDAKDTLEIVRKYVEPVLTRVGKEWKVHVVDFAQPVKSIAEIMLKLPGIEIKNCNALVCLSTKPKNKQIDEILKQVGLNITGHQNMFKVMTQQKAVDAVDVALAIIMEPLSQSQYCVANVQIKRDKGTVSTVSTFMGKLMKRK